MYQIKLAQGQFNLVISDVMRETIRLKPDPPIVDDNFNLKVILWEDRQ